MKNANFYLLLLLTFGGYLLLSIGARAVQQWAECWKRERGEK